MKKSTYTAIFLLLVIMILSILLSACNFKQNSDGSINNGGNNVDENSGNSGNSVTDNNDMFLQALVSLNVRSNPASDSTSLILGTLDKNQTIDFVEKYNDNWYKVIYGKETAYVSAKPSYSKILTAEEYSAIKENLNNEQIKAEQLRLEKEKKINSIIKIGESLIGTPYLYGSQRLLYNDGSFNPYFTGKNFDCSAFVQYIYYKGAGVKLLGDSRSQSTQGVDVSLSNLQTGDIIFMTSSDRMYNTGIERIGHVAIYIGNNTIMHTYGTPGVIVQTYSSFWKERSIKAKRMI